MSKSPPTFIVAVLRRWAASQRGQTEFVNPGTESRSASRVRVKFPLIKCDCTILLNLRVRVAFVGEGDTLNIKAASLVPD